jgi:hypothetical protein
MKKLIIALLIACTLLCTVAFAEEVEEIMLDRFATALTEAGFVYEQDEPYYQLIGAIGGMKYWLDEDTVVELYVYDIEGEPYKQMVETGMTLMSMPVVINGDTALYMEEEELREQIVEMFMAL